MSPSVTGSIADQVREADTSHRFGDKPNAIELLQEALETCRSQHEPLPGWLCGRLAAQYRAMGRCDDEVQLLEEYRDSQVAEDSRTRFDARLSKARTLAERNRRQENGAVASVRMVLTKPRRSSSRTTKTEVRDLHTFTNETRDSLWLAMHAMKAHGDNALDAALLRVNDEARSGNAPVEAIIALFQEIKGRILAGDSSGLSRADYSRALTLMFSVYFDAAAK
ncbi:MAG: hypothetical protein ABJE10_09910 [bacterium]